MTSLVKKVFRSSGRKTGSKKDASGSDRDRKSPTPLPPPSPDLSALTTEEMTILKDVFRRQTEFESEELQRREKLCDNLQTFEEEVRRQYCQKGRLKQVDLRLCRLCLRTKFADGIGKVCCTCHKRVCNRCGSFKLRWNQKKNKMVKGKWQCNMCDMKRDVVAMTGIWYHGDEGRPAIPTDVLQKKISLSEMSSSETDRAVPLSETDLGERTPRSDTDVIREEDDSMERSDDVFGKTVMVTASKVKSSGSRRSSTRSRRRSSSYSEMTLDEEVDNEIDVDQFQRERQIDRLQRHSKRSRRRRRSGNNPEQHDVTTSDSDRLREMTGSSPQYFSSSTDNWMSSDHEVLNDRSGRASNRSHRDGRARGKGKERKELGKTKSPDASWRDGDLRTSIDSIIETSDGLNQNSRRHRVRANGQHYVCDSRRADMSQQCDSFQRHPSSSPKVPSVPSRSKIKDNRSPRNSITSSSPRETRRHYEHRLQRDSRTSRDSCTSRDSNFSRDSFSRPSSGDVSPSKTLNQGSFGHQDAHYSSSSSVFSEHKPSASRSKHSPEDSGRHKPVDVKPAKLGNAQVDAEEKKSSHTLALPRRNSSFSSNSLSPDMALIRNPRKKNRRQYTDGSVSPHRMGSVSPRLSVVDKPGDVITRDVYGRRMTLSHCENIYLPVGRRRSAINDSRPHAIILHRDKGDNSVRTNGLGMRVVGGRSGPDGTLGAYVTMVVKTGPAESQGIREADQIIEWNGRSLVDVTFEEAKDIISQPGSIVQVSVVHNDSEPSSDLGLRSWNPIIVRTGTASVPEPRSEEGLVLSRPKRRMLPKTPMEIKKEERTISGSIWLQLDYDWKCQCLLIVLLRGEGILAQSGDDRRQPNPVVMLHLLPNRAQHEVRESEIKFFTSDPEWNETFVFPDISEEEFKGLALELTVWNFRELEDEFLGEVLLDLEEGPINNTPTCFHLEDHDDNSSPLPYRKKSFSISEVSCTSPGTSEAYLSRNPSPRSSQSTREGRVGSQRTLPTTPGFENMKDFCSLGRKTSSRDMLSSAASSPGLSPTSPAHEYHRNITSMFKKKLGLIARLSSSLIMGSSMKRDMADNDDRMDTLSMPRSQSYTEVREKNLMKLPVPQQRRSFEYNPKRFELLAPPHPSSQSNSSTDLYRQDVDSEDLAGLESDRPAPEGDDITSLLGPGQIPPKPSFEANVHGDIRLGFMVTKGQLEIDVVVVKGLVKSGLTTPPDTYVKTYLVEGSKTVQKKKTQTVRMSFDPFFKKTIKYSACNIHGRCIKVNVWEKQKTFDKKQCLGEAVVKLDNLNLSQQTMAWYKLFPLGAAEFVSSESLNFW